MSAALDTLTAEEQRLFKEMEGADANLAPEPVTEPDPAATPQPEVGPESRPEPKQERTDQKLVDKRALDEERSRRKAAEARAREQELSYAKLATRFEMLNEALTEHNKPAPPPKVEIPSFETDPRGHIEQRLNQIESRFEEVGKKIVPLEKTAEQITQQQKDAEFVRDLQTWGARQEAEFANQTPDYQDAVSFLKQVREDTMRAMNVPEAEIGQRLMQEVLATANLARQQGMNFGEVLYKLAKANRYAPKAVASTPSPVDTSKPARDMVESATERLIRGNDMATTISATGGGARGEIAANAIANMSDEAFAQYYAKVQKQGKSALKNLFGA